MSTVLNVYCLLKLPTETTLLYSCFELITFFKLCSFSLLLLYPLLSTSSLFSLLSLLYYSLYSTTLLSTLSTLLLHKASHILTHYLLAYSYYSNYYYSTTLHLISRLLQLFWIEHIFYPSLSTTTLLSFLYLLHLSFLTWWLVAPNLRWTKDLALRGWFLKLLTLVLVLLLLIWWRLIFL